MQNISNVVNTVYGAFYRGAKYVAAHPIESAAGVAFVGLGLLAGCGGDKEASPLEIATSTPPSKPEATIPAQHDLTPGAYGLTPLQTDTPGPVPTPGIEQAVSENAQKLGEVIKYVRGSYNDERIVLREEGDFGVVVSLKMQNDSHYIVLVRPNDRVEISRTNPGETDPENHTTQGYTNNFIIGHDDADGNVDYASVNAGDIGSVVVFDPSRNTGLEHKDKVAALNKESLDDLITFFESGEAPQFKVKWRTIIGDPNVQSPSYAMEFTYGSNRGLFVVMPAALVPDSEGYALNGTLEIRNVWNAIQFWSNTCDMSHINVVLEKRGDQEKYANRKLNPTLYQEILETFTPIFAASGIKPDCSYSPIQHQDDQNPANEPKSSILQGGNQRDRKFFRKHGYPRKPAKTLRL